MCVCVISNQSTSKKPHYVSENTHQVPSGTKVPRLDMCRSILSLSKTAHQMWHDHLFSQSGWGLEATGKWGIRLDKSENGGGGRQYRGGVFIK